MKGIVIITGTTGAGKTTHSKILAEKIGATYISSGDIARSLMDADTAEKFKDGQLSPHEDRIRTEIHRRIQNAEVVVLDGFPRVPDQLSWLSRSIPAVMYVVRLDWPMQVLVNRWVERMRDEFDTIKAYALRDELYERETKPLFNSSLVISNKQEQHVIDTNTIIRLGVMKWLSSAVPTFKCKDSTRWVALDRFIKDYYITKWDPDRARTWAQADKDIENAIWRIINA